MAKRKKRNRGGGVPFNPDVDTGTKRPVTARVAVGDVNDKFSDYPSNGLTPRRLARIFREADEGNVRAQMELFEEMEEKDTHLFSQMQTRKLGAMGGNLLGGGEAGAEAVLPLSELWKQMTEIVKGVVKGENEESGDTVQQTGANITSALTSKAASVRKEKESKTTTTKETYTSERWGKEGGTTIHQISFTVDISKIKDLPLLYKLIDELKDAQNRTDSPTPATT